MAASLAFYQAIITVVFVADKVNLGFFDFVPTKVISQTLNIPQASMVKILGALMRTGIIETREGSKGGVRLAKKPSVISLFDVYRAIESDKKWFRTDFPLNATDRRPSRIQHIINRMLDQSADAMTSQLDKFTIADITRRASK